MVFHRVEQELRYKLAHLADTQTEEKNDLIRRIEDLQGEIEHLQTAKQENRKADCQKESQKGRQTGRQRHRTTDWQTGREKARKADRETGPTDIKTDR